jgi:hypothetical protein
VDQPRARELPGERSHRARYFLYNARPARTTIPERVSDFRIMRRYQLVIMACGLGLLIVPWTTSAYMELLVQGPEGSDMSLEELEIRVRLALEKGIEKNGGWPPAWRARTRPPVTRRKLSVIPWPPAARKTRRLPGSRRFRGIQGGRRASVCNPVNPGHGCRENRVNLRKFRLNTPSLVIGQTSSQPGP